MKDLAFAGSLSVMSSPTSLGRPSWKDPVDRDRPGKHYLVARNSLNNFPLYLYAVHTFKTLRPSRISSFIIATRQCVKQTASAP
jgi:hypothetical protein